MPGIVGMIGDCASSASMAKALTTIHHFASYSRDQVSPFANVEIGQVWRRSKDAAESCCEDKAAGVCLYISGTVLRSAPNAAHLSASSILRTYLEGDLSPERYDGSFVMCIADPRSRKVIILNDRLGTLPVYYYDGANADQWSYLTELNTDNFGWYGEGTSILLNHYATGADFVVAGDECWGQSFTREISEKQWQRT